MLTLLSLVARAVSELIGWGGLSLRSRQSLQAEILFLRQQLALYAERGARPRRIDAATRAGLSFLSRLFEWRSALVVVQPQTLIRWHQAGFRLLWRWKSRPRRPRIPIELRTLIRQMACDNPLWGQERIANELWLKLGLRVSPRTVRKYLPKAPAGRPRGDQRSSTFLMNHAQAIVACDFFVVVTGTIRLLYVLVVIEHHSRRLLHYTVTAHPSASWTRQQLRGAAGSENLYKYLTHGRASTVSPELNQSVGHLGPRVLKTPPHCPQANGICERVIGTIRRECLDWLIPLSDSHLRLALKSWIRHYNRGRPHTALGPGIPDPPLNGSPSRPKSRHHLGDFNSVRATAILGGLHHQYSMAAA